VVRVGDGRNSRTYLVSSDDGRRCVAKFYAPAAAGRLNRLAVEFDALAFLWEHGIRCIPRPVIADHAWQCGIYDYVAGEPIAASTVGPGDVDRATRFLGALKDLTRVGASAGLPAASEACFSIVAIGDNIDARRARLTAAEGSSREVRQFLAELDAARRRMTAWCEARARDWSIDARDALAERDRTLSPSDFGFHNALRRADGELVFLDFEYFGWDDPAKTVVDVLLHPHPAMAMSVDLRRRFVAAAVPALGARSLVDRVRLVYPLFGLKWCLILLNEFIPAHTADSVRAEQLDKARRMLARVTSEYEDFPYHE